MIYFPILRSGRVSVQLKEISIGDAIRIAAMPTHLYESGTTAFLHSVIDEVQGVSINPLDWTVQERILVVCHYLAATVPGGPDFSLDGGVGRYSDYLDGAKTPSVEVDLVDVGEIGGDQWQCRHLTGRMATAIEMAQGDIAEIDARTHWIVGSMAAQMVRVNESFDTESGLADRMRVLLAYPESEFAQLLAAYYVGREKLHHLFRVEPSDDGLIVYPREAEAKLPPARFPVRSGLSGLAREMGGNPGRSC